MPPKQSAASTSKPPAKRGRPSTSSVSSKPQPNKRRSTGTGGAGAGAGATTILSDAEPSAIAVESATEEDDEDEGGEEDRKTTIPPGLLTRLLHESFTKEGTRISKDANAAVAKYMDVFVREAIARSVAERREGGFLEVEDLEKVAPQLLFDM